MTESRVAGLRVLEALGGRSGPAGEAAESMGPAPRTEAGRRLLATLAADPRSGDGSESVAAGILAIEREAGAMQRDEMLAIEASLIFLVDALEAMRVAGSILQGSSELVTLGARLLRPQAAGSPQRTEVWRTRDDLGSQRDALSSLLARMDEYIEPRS